MGFAIRERDQVQLLIQQGQLRRGNVIAKVWGEGQ